MALTFKNKTITKKMFLYAHGIDEYANICETALVTIISKELPIYWSSIPIGAHENKFLICMVIYSSIFQLPVLKYLRTRVQLYSTI